MKHPMLRAGLLAVCAAFLGVVTDVAAQQTSPPPAIAGTYTLAQVDNGDLPAVVREADGCREELTAATLTLQADNTWNLQTTIKRQCGEQTAEEKTATQQGTFTAAELAIQFAAAPAAPPADPDKTGEEQAPPPIAAPASATLQQNVLTVKLSDEKRQLTFRK